MMFKELKARIGTRVSHHFCGEKRCELIDMTLLWALAIQRGNKAQLFSFELGLGLSEQTACTRAQ